LPLGLHGEAVDRVFDLARRVGVEVAEPAAQVGRAAHLPEQPGQALRPLGHRLGQERTAELLGEVQQDGARFEHADRLGSAAVEQRGDLGIGIDGDEAAAELIALADPDQPGIVLRPA
jgi:hypothetical protein